MLERFKGFQEENLPNNESNNISPREKNDFINKQLPYEKFGNWLTKEERDEFINLNNRPYNTLTKEEKTKHSYYYFVIDWILNKDEAKEVAKLINTPDLERSLEDERRIKKLIWKKLDWDVAEYHLQKKEFLLNIRMKKYQDNLDLTKEKYWSSLSKEEWQEFMKLANNPFETLTTDEKIKYNYYYFIIEWILDTEEASELANLIIIPYSKKSISQLTRMSSLLMKRLEWDNTEKLQIKKLLWWKNYSNLSELFDVNKKRNNQE